MKHDVSIVEDHPDTHGAEYLENFKNDGALEFTCIGSDGTKTIFIDAGWGHFEACPICGDELTIDTEGY